MLLLDGKVAVVTGGSSGNGRAIALGFARQGASVVVADIEEEPREGGEPTVAVIQRDTGAAAEFVRCDVTQIDDLEAAIAAAEALGGIDVMVNNAGILIKEGILDATPGTFERMIDVNVRGTYFGTQAAARRMVERRRGAIINMSSIAGIRGTGGYAKTSEPPEFLGVADSFSLAR